MAFLPAGGWLALIFLLSSRLGSATNTQTLLEGILLLLGLHFSPETLHQLNAAWRVSAHVFLYMVFALLLLRGFRTLADPARTDTTPMDASREWLCVMALVTGCALADEVNQWLSPFRDGELRDFLLDCLGGALAMAGSGLLGRRAAERSRRAPAAGQ